MRGCRNWLAAIVALLVSGPAAAQITLNINGSTDAIPLIAALSRAYAAKTQGVTIIFSTGLDAAARIEALAAGRIEIAVASHGLKIDGLAKQGMRVHEIARAPVVFAVHAGVSTSDVSSAQVCAIYSGKVTNWRALGGPNLAIAARTRPDGEVDAEVVRDAIACLKTLKMPDAVKVMQRGGDMARELAATEGAIGITTMTAVEQSAGKLRALALDGVAPSAANVTSSAYKPVRRVFLVVKGDGSPGVAAFLAFVRGAEGVAIIRANGAIAISGG
jgi:phosphate transport system substrate-binding protein